MKNFFGWVKTHKLTTVLGLVVIAFVTNSLLNSRNSGGFMPVSMSNVAFQNEGAAPASMGMMGYSTDSYVAKRSAGTSIPPMMQQESVDLTASNRKVVRNSDLSILVKDVRASIDSITQQATAFGGFMVNSSVQTPTEGGSGYVSIRVPADKLESMLQFLRKLGVRVISENVTGNDITDQYTDTESRLATLMQTKTTFEAMLSQAKDVDEILRVQQSIFSIQDQIDALKGQLQYLEKTSQSSFISVYLSTDELSLPYSPSEPWRPEVVFKTAVRSMVGHLRTVANAAIWAVVYSPVLLILLLLFWIVKRKLK